MSTRLRSLFGYILLGVILLSVGLAATLAARDLPILRKLLSGSRGELAEAAHDHDHDAGAACEHDHDHGPAPNAADHEGHVHGAEATADCDQHGHEDEDHAHGEYDHIHDEAASLALSKQAEANIGLRLVTVRLQPYDRKITVPAVVVERPGCSQVQITAALTGRVTRIHCIEGEAVTPGMPLFDLRLTHEELVQAQAAFLETAEQLEVVGQEVQRIAKVVAGGAVAGKTLLERQYEQRKLEAVLHALRQRLLLHGLTSQQVDEILATKTLLRDLTMAVPEHDCSANQSDAERLFVVQKLEVQPGEHVEAGQTLAVLADHARLYVEGRAFEEDIPALNEAVARNADVTAVFPLAGGRQERVDGLKIAYLSGTIDLATRAFAFYVELENRLIRDGGNAAKPRFVDWRFKPGQRGRLLVPVQRWENRIVLPSEAVVLDGAEAYVFEHNRDHFDRREVHVEYRDQDSVVIANDGSLKPGVQVAASGAYQIHLATKNKNGPPIDPHAGHNH